MGFSEGKYPCQSVAKILDVAKQLHKYFIIVCQ